MKMIKCEALSKRYGGESVMALDQLNLEVEKNSVYGFLGPNGAGKTTTIKILTGLMSQSSGQAWVAGEAVNKNNTNLRRKIGYLGQEQKMYAWMKGQELLEFVGEIFGLTKRDTKSRRAFRYGRIKTLSKEKSVILFRRYVATVGNSPGIGR
jgi:ABC-2 type transport system ATP-binding protein